MITGALQHDASHTAAGWKAANITTATTTTVNTGAGIIHSLVVNTPVASSTITVYDGGTGGTKLGTITIPATLLSQGPSPEAFKDIAYETSLVIVTVGTSDITVSYI